MTNRKLKLAAMSVALTACVAAQPMAAHAVEGPDADADDTATPQAAPADEDAADSTTPDAADGEEEKQEEFTPPVNEEAKEEEQAPAFGPGTSTDDINIVYKPAVKPEEPGEFGDAGESGETGDTGDTGNAGDTDDTKQPDGTYMEGDVIDTSKDGQVIGSATKEETPESSSSTTVVDPDAEEKKTETVGKDENGNTTITTKTETTGTETTTTTGTGKADSSTTITDTKKGDQITEDDLKEVLGDWKPTWEIDDNTKLPENVEVVSYEEDKTDSNSKTLILKKTDPTEEKKMSAEDIAKLLDVPEGGVEKKTDDEGNTTYILKKEETSTDENGNTVTRVTYYEIDNETNSVKTTTTTTLVLKVEKDTVDGKQDVTETPALPSIIVKNEKDANDSFTIKPSDLDYMLKHPYSKDGNVYTYVESDDTSKRTYTITKTDVESGDYTNEEIAELLNNKLGTTGYTADDNGVYYKGNKLSITDMNAAHMVLSYTVKVDEERYNKDQHESDHAKADAEEAAKLAAIKEALTKAAKEAGIKDEEINSENFLKQLNSVSIDGKTFEYKAANGHTFTFNYTVNGTVTTDSKKADNATVPGKDSNNITDVKDNTVTGTAYVTGGKEEWTESGPLSGKYDYAVGDAFILPEDAKLVKDEGSKKTYEVTTKSDDGKTTTTKIYEVTETTVTLTQQEKEDIAWANLLKQHSEYENIAALKAAGYDIDIAKMDFGTVKRLDWTITETVKQTDSAEGKTLIATGSGRTDWSIDEEAGTITVGKKTYKDVTKNGDSYTCTVEENGVKFTYTFTKKAGKKLEDKEVKDALAKEFGVESDNIHLSDDGKTATFEQDGSTVTVDYSALSETLTIQTDEHRTPTITATIKDDKDLQKAYDELWKQVEEIRKTLKDGETLWIGELEIKSDTTKETVIEHFTKAISPDDMSKDELIKALQKQAQIAQDSDYVANAGTKYEETKKNYYDGTKNVQYFYTDRNGNTIEVTRETYGPEEYFYYWNNGRKEYVRSNQVTRKEQRDDIQHLDLASGSKLDLLPDEDGKVNQTDCVLVSKNLKLEWNDDAEKLVKGEGNTTVGLDNKISWDDEGGEGGGHYEYDRGTPNNNPTKSAYYKLTGTVAYDPIKDDKGNIKLYQGQRGTPWNPGISAEDEAINAYLKATGSAKTAENLTEEERNAIVGTYVVKIGNTGTNNTGATGYQVYLKTSELTAYGYMSRDANTCINSTYKRQDGTWEYVGGYDLMISKLTQVRDGRVIGQTESTIKTITAPLSIRSFKDYTNGSLTLGEKTTTSTAKLKNGYNVSADFKGTYTQAKSENLEGAEATGTDSYKTFTEILRSVFEGAGHTNYDKGGFSYSHRTPDEVTTSAVSKTTETKTDAHVDYNYTTIETRKVPVTSEVTVVVPPVTPPVDPDTPDTPVQDETPDEVVTPETPELPPVQDATPDEVVLPADPELPAVQDATALPQTGVNWFTALGMAFSGMLLMIAGAFTSLKYKEKH